MKKSCASENKLCCALLLLPAALASVVHHRTKRLSLSMLSVSRHGLFSEVGALCARPTGSISTETGCIPKPPQQPSPLNSSRKESPCAQQVQVPPAADDASPQAIVPKQQRGAVSSCPTAGARQSCNTSGDEKGRFCLHYQD